MLYGRTSTHDCAPATGNPYALASALQTALGPGLGLVRVLYFDKPPGQSWALPWHKDLTIAVRANRLRLLAEVRDTLRAVGDFSQLPL